MPEAKVLKPKEGEQQDNTVETINKRWEIGKKFLKPYLDNFIRYYKIYRAYVNDEKLPTRHKTFNPYLFSAIETATSKATANKPKGTYVPVTPDDNPETEKHNMLFDYYYGISEEQMFLKTSATFKKNLIYGTAIGEVFWRFETGVREGKETIVANRPGFRLLNPENEEFVFDPEAESLESAKWFIKKDYWTKKDVEDIKASPFASQFQNLDELLKAFDTQDFEKSSYKQEKLSVVGAVSVKDETIIKAEALHQYAGGKLQTLVGKRYLVRDIPNPYNFNHPFIYCIDHIVPNELLGMGEIEPTERLQHTLNTIENQRRDNVALAINRMVINTPRGAEDEGELVSSPGGIINVKDINGIEFIDMPDVTQSSYQEADSIKGDIQNALSISNFSKGTDEVDTTQKSGVAIQKLQSAADARIQTKMQLFEEMFLKQLAEKWLILHSQFGNKELPVRITGKKGTEFKTVSKEDIAGKYDYQVEAGSTRHTDKTADRMEFNEFMERLLALADRKKMTSAPPQIDKKTGQQIPQTPDVVDVDKLAETLSEKYGIKNFEEFWIMGQPQQSQPQGEMLPSTELQERTRNYGEGEMLPDISEITNKET